MKLSENHFSKDPAKNEISKPEIVTEPLKGSKAPEKKPNTGFISKLFSKGANKDNNKIAKLPVENKNSSSLPNTATLTVEKTSPAINAPVKRNALGKIFHFFVIVFLSLLSFIIDTLFFLFTYVLALFVIIVVVYLQQHDLAVINEILRNNINESLIVLYSLFFIMMFKYYVIIPRIIHSTIGQFFIRRVLIPKEKITGWGVFMYYMMGGLWSLVLFPYTIFALLFNKKRIPELLSGLKVDLDPQRYKMQRGWFFALIYVLLFIASGAYVGYIVQTGPTAYIEQFIDHEKQIKQYISASTYTPARLSLQKYQKYSGETDQYWYYSCVIEGHLDLTEATLTICDTAETKNLSEDQKKNILVLRANLLRSLQREEESLALYQKLWDEMSVKTFDMINYVYLLDAKGDRENSSKVLDELFATLGTEEINTVQMLFFAELYYNLENYNKALEIYEGEIAKLSEETSETIKGELYYKQGLTLYHLGEYAKATEAFTSAKTANPDYTDSADAYIIQIEFSSKKK